MGDYEELRSMFRGQPFCTVDVSTGEARLVSEGDAFRSLLDDDPMHQSRATINAASALTGFAKLKGVGTEDRSFTIDEIAKVAGMQRITAHNYVARAIFKPSITGRTGGYPGLQFSWRDAYVAGLIGAFRRLGLHPDLLKAVSNLFYQSETKPKKKRTGGKHQLAARP